MSNFYPAPYTVTMQEFIRPISDRVQGHSLFDGTLTFNWSEQGFMLHKCLVFIKCSDSNYEVFRQIMSAPSPAEAKALGRQIRGYDDSVWKQYRHHAMYWNLLWKFTQNGHLAHKLLDTFPLILAEATTNDTIWGIGLNVNDPKVQDKSKWKGQNLLGEALMQVRDTLRGQ